MPGRILIVDDDQGMCEMLASDLSRRGFQVAWRTSAEEAFQVLVNEDFDVAVTDLNMPKMNGLELCQRIVANRPNLLVIVITAFGSLESAIAAIRAGAYDFIMKPFEMEALALALERAVQHRSLREEVKRLRQAVKEAEPFGNILGMSPVMKNLFPVLDRLAKSDSSVLITGETGSGKELVARAIHQRSRRHPGPFLAVNCSAVPESLLESELFGHVRGAFTGAEEDRQGLFIQAHGGTLFLDEIADLPLHLQPKILRALEGRTVRPVGGDREIPFDVRLVSATHRDLETEVEEGRFREDLFFRINVIHLAMPPLRARGNDILILAQSFLEHFANLSAKKVQGLTGEAAQKLLNYAWPGNVRELKNYMERAVALTQHEQITVEDLPEKVRDYRRTQIFLAGDDPSELLSMKQVERRYIEQVLEAVGHNQSLAAKILGFDRKTLYRKLKEPERPFKPGEQKKN